MYDRRYGLIRTLAPLHVGASEGEDSGNLNLIFRDPFTQTGIIPGSSIRGRFRNECELTSDDPANCESWYGNSFGATKSDETGKQQAFIKEGCVKFEYASVVWLPVFCPGQPIVWVSCPGLLRRYAACAKPTLNGMQLQEELPKCYTFSKMTPEDQIGAKKRLFFNLGFIELEITDNLESWMPKGFGHALQSFHRLVIVDDADIGMIHDMALYRQSRVKLDENQKVVKNFFNVEALPEGSVLVFPVATKPHPVHPTWAPFGKDPSRELYFGGLESVGFGRCQVMIPSTTP